MFSGTAEQVQPYMQVKYSYRTIVVVNLVYCTYIENTKPSVMRRIWSSIYSSCTLQGRRQPFLVWLNILLKVGSLESTRMGGWFGLVYWGLTPQQQPGSYQGGEMMMIMMKSVLWWRKPEYPEETTDLRQVTDETFHTEPEWIWLTRETGDYPGHQGLTYMFPRSETLFCDTPPLPLSWLVSSLAGWLTRY